MEAQQEESFRHLIQDCLNFNLVHDLNKCIDNFQYLTTKYEEEQRDQQIFIEPHDFFKVIIQIYHKLSTDDTEVENLIDKYNNILAFNTKQIINRYTKQFLKKDKEEVEFFLRMCEEQIFDKEWSKYLVWEELQEFIVLKGKREEDKHLLKEEEYEVEEVKYLAYLEKLKAQYKQISEKYSSISSLNVKTEQDIQDLIKLNFLPKHRFIELFPILEPEQQVNQYARLLDGAQDVPTYEFTLLSQASLPFLSGIDRSLLTQNSQLIKRISQNFFIRLRYRFQELKHFLFTLKQDYVEYKTAGDKKKIKDILEISKEEEKTKILENLTKILSKYATEVDEEAKRIEPFIQETLKYLNMSINPKLLPSTIIHKVGSLDLGTLFTIEKDFWLDLALFNTELNDSVKLQEEIFANLQLKDSEIRIRGDDLTIKTYINRRYPTVKCADPSYEIDYSVRLIFLKEEHDYLVKHHESFKSIIESNEHLKVLFINVSSWMKNFLYDISIKFDMFSSYEVQLIFMHFLIKSEILKRDESQDYLKLSLSTSDLPYAQLFLDFLRFLAFDLNMIETQLYLPCLSKEQLDEEEELNEYSFYQLKDQHGKYVDRRRNERDYSDVVNMYTRIWKTLDLIKAGLDFFD